MDVAKLIKEVATKLELEALANQDALQGLPAHQATRPTAAETSALAEAERCGEKELQQVDKLLQETQSAITSLGKSLFGAGGKRKRVQSSVPPQLIDTKVHIDSRDRAIAAYNAFKRDNKLVPDATGDDRMTQVLWAFIIMTLEGLVNSYFYAPVSEFGYLGGFSIAFFVSFANVAFAFIGGAGGLRYLSHVDVLKKLVGVFVSLACLFICLVVIALSTFFRGHVDLLSQRGELGPAAMESEAWSLAVDSLRTLDVWALMSSVNSFLLVLVGLVCAILAFHKGWQYDDPYPGFGAVFRAKERATEAYDDVCKQNADTIADWQSRQINDLQDAEDCIEKSLADVKVTDQGLNFLLMQSQGLGLKVSRLASGLLGVYRKKNQAIRAQAAPAYFDTFPDDSQFSHFDTKLADRRKEATRLAKACAQAHQEAGEEQKLIQDAIDRVRSRGWPQ